MGNWKILSACLYICVCLYIDSVGFLCFFLLWMVLPKLICKRTLASLKGQMLVMIGYSETLRNIKIILIPFQVHVI